MWHLRFGFISRRHVRLLLGRIVIRTRLIVLHPTLLILHAAELEILLLQHCLRRGSLVKPWLTSLSREELVEELSHSISYEHKLSISIESKACSKTSQVTE